jgi:penicillin-binding protein 1C
VTKLRALAGPVRVVAALLLGLVAWVATTPLPSELASEHADASLRVLDANDRLLREVRADDGARARFIRLAELGPRSRDALLAAEDHRFYAHIGVDPLAVARAVTSALLHLRVTSGASTITMQLARTVRPHPRTLLGKVSEMLLALRIEASLSKDRILEEYMNRVSFGPNLRGFSAASYAFFGKPPANLSVAEAAFLAALPRAPSEYAKAKNRKAVEQRRNRVIDSMQALGTVDADVAQRAHVEPLRRQLVPPVFGAPHLVQGLIGGALRRHQPALAAVEARSVAQLATTIDSALQTEAISALRATLDDLRDRRASAGAVLVVDNASGDVLAYVGSPDFFDAERLGQNDGARALRQPGSTLKPFLYALAIEKLGFTPATILPDIESHFVVQDGTFSPHDYDGKLRGPVRLREALGNSLNIPAVWTLSQLRVEPFYTRLHELGFDSLTEAPEHYGLALALGDGEVTLLDLAAAYATLARDGVYKPLRFVRRVDPIGAEPFELPPGEERRVMPELAAAQVTDILSDPRARTASFGARTMLDFSFPVAAKTGTSKGYRDNWVVGYTRAVTVAVWIGNFDGSEMGNMSGITGAGPIFHAVMDAAMRGRAIGADATSLSVAGRPGLHRVEICPLSGGLATPDCPHKIQEWVDEPGLLEACNMHEHVRIRRADGLRAGPTCSAEEVEERGFERFPPEYLAWAVATSRPLAPQASSPLCPAAPAAALSAVGAPGILFPQDGARFVMDPERAPALQVLAIPLAIPSGEREATLLVDGEGVDTVRSPFVAHWRLQPGAHVLSARTSDDRTSEPLHVYVRGD